MIIDVRQLEIREALLVGRADRSKAPLLRIELLMVYGTNMASTAATYRLDGRLRRTIRVRMLLGHLFVDKWQIRIDPATHLLHFQLSYGLLLARLILEFIHVRL